MPPIAENEPKIDRPDAAVLDRQGIEPVKKVVAHQEQAIEPSVEANAAGVVGSAPKKVKTVSVRPDGTVIENAPTPPAIVKATAAPTMDAAAKHAATTPKPAAKPVTTPKNDKPAAAAKPKAQKVAANQDAAPVDDVGDSQQAGGTHAIEKGGFAVQFGAATSEAEARALVTKIATKYGSHLGGRRPTFKMAKVGDKTVYRVRVGGISKEAAAKVCSEVKGGGGSCFVASAN